MNVLRRLSPKTILGLCLETTLLLAATPNAHAATVTLRMYSSLPADENSSHYIWYERFKSNLEAKVKDAITVNYFPNAMLGKEADAVQQVRLGAVDMMISGTSIWSTIAPEIGVLDLGYLFADYDHVGRALDGKAGEILSTILAAKANVKPLGYGYSLGARNVYTRQPISKPADLQNMKIRVLPVPNFIATLKAMGAAPIPMPGGEVYSGLQMGLIDGLEHDAPTVLASKFYEIAKYGTLTQHIYNPIVVVINKAMFDRIPEALRGDVIAAATEATNYERKLAASTESKAFEDLKAHGVTVTATDRAFFRQAVMPIWADFSAKYPATVPILEAIRAVEHP
ncbi:MAG TPA: TRAP transporter substrate-binding protein [Telmatospirillum sp.]|nr:TRAP transporter substrate-binding protein [Telmatospirillum sp.]